MVPLFAVLFGVKRNGYPCTLCKYSCEFRTFQAEIEAQKKLVLKMEDNVEADLEALEALAIATEDIILRRMDEEREK